MDIQDLTIAVVGATGAVGTEFFLFGDVAVVLKKLAEQAAPYFDYIDIIESHHEAKIDAPSGFAMALA